MDSTINSPKSAKANKALNSFPKHISNLSYFVINNCDIRRFISLAIIKQMKEKGLCDDNAFVQFKYNKFAVKCKGLTKEYSYSEPIFIYAMIAGAQAMSRYATNVLLDFVEKDKVDINFNDADEYITALTNSINTATAKSNDKPEEATAVGNRPEPAPSEDKEPSAK